MFSSFEFCVFETGASTVQESLSVSACVSSANSVPSPVQRIKLQKKDPRLAHEIQQNFTCRLCEHFVPRA